MIAQINRNKLQLALSVVSFLGVIYLLGIRLEAALTLACVYAFFKFRLKGFRAIQLVVLFLASLVSSYYILKFGPSQFYLPFSTISMLTVLLFNNATLALLITIASGVSVASFARDPFTVFLLFLASGVFSSLLVQGARKRSTIIKVGFLTGLLQVLLLGSLTHFSLRVPGDYPVLFLNGIFSSFIVLGMLPVFEYLFTTVTPISLLELADFHHPLMQQLILQAPGTYHHSLIVGNLSESASEAVGANALLARLGAYYHDIGKLQKPEYFSENQQNGESKHDTLSPNMSKMIIMNHVKEGLELAKKYRLKPALTNFIMQHHGNSLVYYFYRRALEELEEDLEVKEEGFRYPGPKPTSKETAIVLLADSVEAASRALKEPSPVKIQEIVRKVINNKFIDGQLDECDLTLKDLEKISAVFTRILGGIYHSRVDYPEEEKSENNHKKLSKEDSRQSEKDKKSNS